MSYDQIVRRYLFVRKCWVALHFNTFFCLFFSYGRYIYCFFSLFRGCFSLRTSISVLGVGSIMSYLGCPCRSVRQYSLSIYFFSTRCLETKQKQIRYSDTRDLQSKYYNSFRTQAFIYYTYFLYRKNRQKNTQFVSRAAVETTEQKTCMYRSK